MNIDYFMKIQNAYGTKNRREKELIKVNQSMSKHFTDTFGTEEVLINGTPRELMIIKDTDGNTFKKKIKSKHDEKFNLGDYVKWNNQIWLITLVDVDEKTWNRGYMYLCTVPLRWQNSEGKIIERYAYSEDFTKYSNGITGNNTITIGDNQYGLTLPVDNETKKLYRDMRFSIDFDDSEKPDIYKLTNRKVKLNDNQYFGRGGTMIITMSFDAFNQDNDKRVLMDNGQEVWICDYKDTTTPLPPSNETTVLNAVISFKGKQEFKIGGSTKTLTGNFMDVNGNQTTDVGIWQVITIDELLPYVKYTIDNNILKIKILENNFVGSKIRIIFSNSTTTATTYLDFDVVNSF